MHLELIIIDGPQAGRRVPLEGRTPVTFGRSFGATIPFQEDRFMSGMHLTVQYALSCVILCDMRSSNGTFLNGERITQAMAVPGDLIKIGTLTMQLKIAKPPVKEAVEPPPPEPHAETIVEEIPETVLLPEVIEPVAESTPDPVKQLHHAVLEVLRRTALPLFCLLDVGAQGTIPSLLHQAPELKESLYDGDSENILAQWAPYIVMLGADSELLRALVDKGWGQGWASFFTSDASFDDLSTHFRKFFMVQLEGGKEVYFRFYNPGVLREFLPAASAEELTVFFGPVEEWLIEAKSSIALLRITNASDGLRTMIIPVTDTPAMTEMMPAS
jgi:pSer/pThr/pTyr-binding forkhead associated (FHA) protein